LFTTTSSREGVDRRLDRRARRRLVRHVERDRADLVAVALDQVGELLGLRAVATSRCPLASTASASARPRPRELPVINQSAPFVGLLFCAASLMTNMASRG